VEVPAPSKQADGNRDRRSNAAAPALRKGGAGLEIDLADPRQRDRLPPEFRGGLPDRGIVNFFEAQAVVRYLAALAIQPPEPAGNSAEPATAGPSMAVLALYGSQADLIRRLVAQTPALASPRFKLEIGTPALMRQREADLVLVSMTRSHTHRPVAFGENPHA